MNKNMTKVLIVRAAQIKELYENGKLVLFKKFRKQPLEGWDELDVEVGDFVAFTKLNELGKAPNYYPINNMHTSHYTNVGWIHGSKSADGCGTLRIRERKGQAKLGETVIINFPNNIDPAEMCKAEVVFSKAVIYNSVWGWCYEFRYITMLNAISAPVMTTDDHIVYPYTSPFKQSPFHQPSYLYPNRFKQVEPEEVCLHESCPTCGGTGINKYTGGPCIHGIACPCKKCTMR